MILEVVGLFKNLFFPKYLSTLKIIVSVISTVSSDSVHIFRATEIAHTVSSTGR